MRVWMKQTGLPLLATVACVLISFVIAYAAHRHRLLRFAEFELHDRLLAHRARAAQSESPCVIVAVREGDILGWHGPMPDRVMAQLLDRLVKGKAAAIGVDIWRDYPVAANGNDTTTSAQADQQRLEDVVENKGVPDDEFVPIIMPHLIADTVEHEVMPPLFFKDPLDASQIGFVDALPDDDEVVRRALLNRADHQNRNCQSMPLLLAQAYLQSLDHPVDLVPGVDRSGRQLLQAGPSTFGAFGSDDGAYVGADDSGFQILMDYAGPGHFPTLSVSDVLSPDFDAVAIRRKVVLIGIESDSVKDYVRTPVQSREYGVALHATIADQIIRAATTGHAVMDVASNSVQLAALMLLSIAGGVVGWQMRSWQFLIALAAVVTALFFVEERSLSHGIWVPTVPLMLGFLLSAGTAAIYMSYRERLDRLAMMQLFGRSVSPDVAQIIWRERYEIFDHGRLKTRKLSATVLFTDLVGFTAIASRLDEHSLIDWLNEYFEKISSLVRDWGGNINKFNGDQIVAVFGPPLERDERQVTADARGAVSCAIRMRAGLCELNEHWRIQGRPQVNMRIGVHTGELVAGSLGSRERQEWTVIGDTVNIASRLESFDKTEMSPDIAADGCRILISGNTFDRLDKQTLEARSLGQHALTRKGQEIQVIGVIGYGSTTIVPSGFVTGGPSSVDRAKGNNQTCDIS